MFMVLPGTFSKYLNRDYFDSVISMPQVVQSNDDQSVQIADDVAMPKTNVGAFSIHIYDLHMELPSPIMSCNLKQYLCKCIFFS